MSYDLPNIIEQDLLEIIAANTAHTDYSTSRVLILFEFQGYYIGDTICRLCYLRTIRLFFNRAQSIRLNCPDKKVIEILKFNPYVDSVTSADLNDIRFEEYDLVLVTYLGKEEELLQLLTHKYQQALRNATMPLRVFSINRYFNNPWNSKVIFPEFPPLISFAADHLSEALKELFVLPDETAWAEQWLRAAGLKQDERLIIVVDDTTRRTKLVPSHVHFEMVQYFLDKPQTRILIFDEKGLGKRSFYRQWLGEPAIDRFIFVENRTLREAFAIISSRSVRMIWGPCSGLMHCASAIYTSLVRRGLPLEQSPLMVVYAGKEILDPSHKWDWWGNDIVHCLLVRKDHLDNVKILLLEQFINDNLSCANYTSGLIISFLEKQFRSELESRQLL